MPIKSQLDINMSIVTVSTFRETLALLNAGLEHNPAISDSRRQKHLDLDLSDHDTHIQSNAPITTLFSFT